MPRLLHHISVRYPDCNSEGRKSMHFWPLAPIFEAMWLSLNW